MRKCITDELGCFAYKNVSCFVAVLVVSLFKIVYIKNTDCKRRDCSFCNFFVHAFFCAFKGQTVFNAGKRIGICHLCCKTDFFCVFLFLLNIFFDILNTKNVVVSILFYRRGCSKPVKKRFSLYDNSVSYGNCLSFKECRHDVFSGNKIYYTLLVTRINCSRNILNRFSKKIISLCCKFKFLKVSVTNVFGVFSGMNVYIVYAVKIPAECLGNSKEGDFRIIILMQLFFLLFIFFPELYYICNVSDCTFITDYFFCRAVLKATGFYIDCFFWSGGKGKLRFRKFSVIHSTKSFTQVCPVL